MKGASNFKKPGDIDLEAFLAGNDVLLFAENVPVAIKKFKEASEMSQSLKKKAEEPTEVDLKKFLESNEGKETLKKYVDMTRIPT